MMKEFSELNKCQNMLLGIAIGDAFGAGYEGKKRYKVLKHFTLSRYSRKKEWKRGKYTDDTQMSIAVAELLLSNQIFNKINLVNSFVRCYKRDPHSGYASGSKNALKNSENGEEFISNVKGNSIRNGAAMRAVPIGILSKLKDVINYAKINASTTHNTPKGITSSVCVAAASHYFYYQMGESKKVFDFCINACKGLDKESINYFKNIQKMKYLDPELLFGKENVRFGVPVDGMRTAGAVLYIISKFFDSSKQALIESVLLGGDTDSTASISLGIIAMNQGLRDLPDFLFNDLENGKYGRDYLIKLGEKLSFKYLLSK